MRSAPQKVEKYDAMVWSNVETDEMRKTECLCLNCADQKHKRMVCSVRVGSIRGRCTSTRNAGNKHLNH